MYILCTADSKVVGTIQWTPTMKRQTIKLAARLTRDVIRSPSLNVHCLRLSNVASSQRRGTLRWWHGLPWSHGPCEFIHDFLQSQIEAVVFYYAFGQQVLVPTLKSRRTREIKGWHGKWTRGSTFSECLQTATAWAIVNPFILFRNITWQVPVASISSWHRTTTKGACRFNNRNSPDAWRLMPWKKTECSSFLTRRIDDNPKYELWKVTGVTNTHQVVLKIFTHAHTRWHD